MKDCIDITVALITYNRSNLLRQSLASLLNQKLDYPLSYEIIIVDDGSTDDTRELVNGMAIKSDIPIKYIYQNGKGVAGARNTSIEEARGVWIAFFDDDQIAEPEYLMEMYLTAQRHGADCVGSTRLLKLQQEQHEQIHPFCRSLLGEIIYVNEIENTTWKWFPCSGNSLVKRGAIEKVGGFNESLMIGGSDLDFFRKFRMTGIKVWQTPNAVSHHIIPKYRLSSEYLKRSALRSGANLAYMNYKEWGMSKTIFLTAKRILHAMIILLPRLVWAKFRSGNEKAFGEKCRLLKAIGYIRKFLQLCFPKIFNQKKYFIQLEFRQEKEKERRAYLNLSESL